MRLILVWYFMILGKINMPLKLSEMFVKALEKHYGPVDIHVTEIAKREMDAHKAARAPPKHRELLAMHTAIETINKMEFLGMEYPEPFVAKWRYIRPELEEVTEHFG
jgi:hypothetical protein